jgi:type IV pilus assembly protein PilZ
MAAEQDDRVSGSDRREHTRYDTSIAVDYASGDTFLFAYLTNISEMGIFVRTNEPLTVGTRLRLRFHADDADPFVLDGEVTWINPYRENGENLNPGMGVRFIELTPDRREQVVAMVRTVAYLRDD